MKYKNLLREIVMHNELEMLEILSKREGFDLDTGLMIVSSTANVDAAKYLISIGADVNAHNGFPLAEAAWYGDLPMLKLLIEHGADIHMGDDKALRNAAARYGKHSIDMVKYLLEQGANIHAYNSEAFYNAAYSSTEEMISILLDHKDADIKGADGHEALLGALFSNRLLMITYLMDRGVDSHYYNDYAIKWAHENSSKQVCYMLENYEEFKQKDSEFYDKITKLNVYK